MKSGALIEGPYRYRLWRQWGLSSTVAFVMLNPSTADATEDDATIRRCVGFCRREGYGGLEVVNLFSYRATDPKDLARAPNPVGPDNDYWMRFVLRKTFLVIAAWGSWNGPLVGTQVQKFRKILREEGRTAYCLGTTKAGAPRHPLYLSRDTALERWAR